VERGVQRTFLDEQVVVADHPDPFGNRVSMPGTPRQRLEDQHVERAAYEPTIRVEHRSPL
jgi:hypothetical protein